MRQGQLFRHLLQEKAIRACSHPTRFGPWPTCASTAKCARQECPAHVDVPKLMLEAKAANVEEHGLDRKDWFLARPEMFTELGSAFRRWSIIAWPALPGVGFWKGSSAFRRLRRLPRLTDRPFVRQAHGAAGRGNLDRRRPRVAYFVDAYANFIDPQIAESVVAVLHHNGFDVYVPTGQRGCGVAALATATSKPPAKPPNTTCAILGEAAREGYTILCSEPTAALMLRRDYLDLVDDPDAKLVSAQTVEFTTFLWDLHKQGRLRTRFSPPRHGHRPPCSVPFEGPGNPALPCRPCCL